MIHSIASAVILAAGMGNRLRSQLADRPKAFLQLGERPIIEESIERLKQCGIRHIVIVTGYLPEHFEKLASRHAEIVTVHNPQFAKSGSMYSLACAAPLVAEDFLLVESDLVYEQRALECVLAHSEDNCVLLSGPTGAGDEIFVSGDGAFIRGMSKDRQSLSSVVGELVGISKISQKLLREMLHHAQRLFSASLHAAYETDCLAAVAERTPIAYHLQSDLLWGEIDDENHLRRVRDNVYPTIIAAERIGAAQAAVRRNILLNPGPATTTDTVKYAQVAPDICPREGEFVALLTDVRRELCRVVNGGSDHTCILFGGSGTAAVEAAISSVTPPSGKLLVLNNGAYGQRIWEIATAYDLPRSELRFPSTRPIDPCAVRQALRDDPTITHVAAAHHETSTGLLNPIGDVLSAVHDCGAALIVDAISSYAAIPIDVARTDIDYLISTSNKCIGGMAGLAFVICRRAAVESTQSIAPRSYYLNLYRQHRSFETSGQMQFTPPVQTVYALRQALREYFAEGAQRRYERYSRNWQTLTAGLAELGFELLLPESLQSRILTTVVEPDHDRFDFALLHDRLYARGFTIYPGKLDEQTTFRIANMGAINDNDIRRFIAVLDDELRQMGVDLRNNRSMRAA